VCIQTMVFWDLTQSGSVDIYQRLKKKNCSSIDPITLRKGPKRHNFKA